MKRAAFALLLLSFAAHGQEVTRSKVSDSWWLEAAAAISPDSGVFHAEDSAVGDRKDVRIRYQPGIFGLVFSRHTNHFDSELDQESYDVHNTIFGFGGTIRFTPIGSLHLVAQALYQSGRSDYHAFVGPAGTQKTEVAADIEHASGFAAGLDVYFPLIYGAWLSAGAGFESNGFQYQVPVDPNNDGRVNIRKTFTYLRGGLAWSFDF